MSNRDSCTHHFEHVKQARPFTEREYMQCTKCGLQNPLGLFQHWDTHRDGPAFKWPPRDNGGKMTSPYIHPYPDYIVEAIHDQLEETYAVRDIPVVVEEVLEWLWQAQRIDTLQQLQQQVPDFATIIDKDGNAYKAFEVQNPDMFPVRVVYWKDD